MLISATIVTFGTKASLLTKKSGVQLRHNRLWYFQQTNHVSTNLYISIFCCHYVLNVKQVEMSNAVSLFQLSSSDKEKEVLSFSLRLTSYQVNLKNHCTETKLHNHEVWLKTPCHVEPAALLCPGSNQELIHLFWHKCGTHQMWTRLVNLKLLKSSQENKPPNFNSTSSERLSTPC